MDRDPETSKRPRILSPTNSNSFQFESPISQCQSEFQMPISEVANLTLDRNRASVQPKPRPDSLTTSTSRSSLSNTQSQAPLCLGCKEKSDSIEAINKRYGNLAARFENKRIDCKNKKEECEDLKKEIRILKGEEVAEKSETSLFPSTPHSQTSEPSTPMPLTPTLQNRCTLTPLKDADEKNELSELRRKLQNISAQLQKANYELRLQTKKTKDLEAEREQNHAEVRRLNSLIGSRTKEITQLKASESELKVQYQKASEKLEYDTAKWKLSKKKLEDANETNDCELNKLREQFDQLTETVRKTNEKLIQYQSECLQLRNLLKRQSQEFETQKKRMTENATEEQKLAVEREGHRIRTEVLSKFKTKDEECEKLSTLNKTLNQNFSRAIEESKKSFENAYKFELERNVAEAKKQWEPERYFFQQQKQVYETQLAENKKVISDLKNTVHKECEKLKGVDWSVKQLKRDIKKIREDINSILPQAESEIAQMPREIRERDKRIQQLESELSQSYQTLKKSVDQQEALTGKLLAMTRERDYWKNSYQPTVRDLLEQSYSNPPPC
ncbi:hypothetical protein M3Y96_00475600 [Aphelenchoides besseyi]|nr:hypothetical protein M3Y96_00475600 [Aphelenchoides besseyi]